MVQCIEGITTKADLECFHNESSIKVDDDDDDDATFWLGWTSPDHS